MNDQGHPAKSGGACAVWSGAGLTARTASCHPIALCGDLSERLAKPPWKFHREKGRGSPKLTRRDQVT